MHPKNGLSERRHCSFTSYEIFSPEDSRKNASFHFHRLENVSSRGKFFGIYSEQQVVKPKRAK